jgi:tetratricopeptide (TPR) repeat protein
VRPGEFWRRAVKEIADGKPYEFEGLQVNFKHMNHPIEVWWVLFDGAPQPPEGIPGPRLGPEAARSPSPPKYSGKDSEGIRLLTEGNLAYLNGENAKGRNSLVLARSEFEKTGSIYGQVQALLVLANLEAATSENDKARELYARAKALAIQSDDFLNQAYISYGLAELESHIGDNDSARHAYIEAKLHFARAGFKRGEALVARGLGKLGPALAGMIRHYSSFH